MQWFSKQIELFKIRGIPIRVDYSWFVIFIVYTWTISSIYLPSMVTGMNGLNYWLLGLITTLLLFASVLAHEMAHALVARSEGIGIRGITLYIFGGLAHLEREPSNPLADFKIAVAGPAMSFLLSVIFYGLAEWLFHGTLYLGPSKVLLHLGVVNLLLACFNLLPGFPMDGGRILRAILWHREKSYEQATRASIKAGAAVALSLILVGVITLLMQRDWLTGLWSIITGLLLVQLLSNLGPKMTTSLKSSAIKSDKNSLTVGQVMVENFTSLNPEMTIKNFLKVYESCRYTTFPVIVAHRLYGILLAADACQLKPEAQANTLVRDLMQPVSQAHFVAHDLSVDQTAAQLTGNKLGYAAVLDNEGRVVGYVGLEDLSNKVRA